MLATQNPIEYEGTYPLPEAQLDRFMVRVSLGYPSVEDEKDMLADHSAHDRVLDLEAVAAVGEVLAAQEAVAGVHGSDALRRYIVTVLDATREDPRVELGASPRAGLMLFRAAKALAALDGPRPRAARRRAGAGARGAHPPAAAGARGRGRRPRRRRPGRARARPGSCRTPCIGARAAGAATLGAAMALAALLFDSASLWVPAVALIGLSVGAAVWVTLAAPGRRDRRARPGPATIEEEQPYPLRLELRQGLLPPPGGELREPLLDAPIPLAGARPGRCASTCASRAAASG